MNLGSIIDRLKITEKFLASGIQDALLVEANTLCAKIANRVIETGKDSDNQAFTPYSTIEVPAFFFSGRSRSSGAEKRVKAASKKKTQLSYKDFREINNLPTSQKNFSFTNDMWRHFGVKKMEGNGGFFKVTIGGTTTSASDKIGWLSEQEGQSIINPNVDEKEDMKKNIIDKIKQKLK